MIFSRIIATPNNSIGLLSNLLKSGIIKENALVQFRQMSDHRTFPLSPSRFQYDKFKDTLHFFAMIGLIPIAGIVTYCNVFIGPATLTEIPEGYKPKHWEYFRHPISRFIARYMQPSTQQEYEKMCHYLYEESERMKLRELDTRVKRLMSERNDYQAYYYRPAIAKYHRISKEVAEDLEALRGD